MAKNKLKISVRNLVEFVMRSGDLLQGSSSDYLAQAIKAHISVQQAGGVEYLPEQKLSHCIEEDDLVLQITGRADGIINQAHGFTIDEIKTTNLDLPKLHEDHNPLHWAQAQCYAYIYASQHNLETIRVQLTYYHLTSEQVKRFCRTYSIEELTAFFDKLVKEYLLWTRKLLQWQHKRNRSIKQLAFPFSSYRQGQRKLLTAVYNTIGAKKKLFVQAPTGLGKTIAVLYPAIKTIEENKIDKIFYLTAKNTTATIAETALQQMRAAGLHLKSLTLVARDKICFHTPCTLETCVYAQGYFDRISAAIETVFCESVFTQDIIEKYARQHQVCPFEFSLDLALYTDCIICDYNYAFDPRVYLRRFFQIRGSYCLLIDEAHNLVDRIRDMFSAELWKSHFLKIRRQVKATLPQVASTLTKINSYMLKIKKSLPSPENLQVQQDLPTDIVPLLQSFIQATDNCLATNAQQSFGEDLLELYFEVLAFLRIREYYDEHYTTYFESHARELKLKIFCLDPSTLLKKLLKRGKSTILFSATLIPISYFTYILGGDTGDFQLQLPSSFPKNNFAVLLANTIATTYRRRDDSYQRIARYIHLFTKPKRGNYLVFFPSYKYMQAVVEVFCRDYSEHHVVIQEAAMDISQRQDFLANFSPGNDIIGFVVMGGIFGEGIDLAGEKLSGAIVIGVGLPQICMERNIIRNYFHQCNGMGFEYAYIYPGMNKVLQAVGRVIRKQDDTGIALLIDERFAQAPYRHLLPEHWKTYAHIGNTHQLSQIVAKFWSQLP